MESKRPIHVRGAGWGDRPLFLFDTVMTGAEESTGRWAGTAAHWIHDLVKESGLRPQSPVLHIEVTGMRAPLVKDAAERAKAYAKDALAIRGK